jgi:hypothetical protein
VSQNLVSITFSETQLAAVNKALTDLETELSALIALDVSRRRKLMRMGDKSETFCRQTINVLKQNPQVVPPSVNVAEANADLLALDQLRPFMQRLTRLAERSSDTEIALGSDAMTVALQGYALLKVAGKNQGLEGLRRDLGTRFAKATRSVEVVATA